MPPLRCVAVVEPPVVKVQACRCCRPVSANSRRHSLVDGVPTVLARRCRRRRWTHCPPARSGCSRVRAGNAAGCRRAVGAARQATPQRNRSPRAHLIGPTAVPPEGSRLPPVMMVLQLSLPPEAEDESVTACLERPCSRCRRSTGTDAALNDRPVVVRCRHRWRCRPTMTRVLACADTPRQIWWPLP